MFGECPDWTTSSTSELIYPNREKSVVTSLLFPSIYLPLLQLAVSPPLPFGQQSLSVPKVYFHTSQTSKSLVLSWFGCQLPLAKKRPNQLIKHSAKPKGSSLVAFYGFFVFRFFILLVESFAYQHLEMVSAVFPHLPDLVKKKKRKKPPAEAIKKKRTIIQDAVWLLLTQCGKVSFWNPRRPQKKIENLKISADGGLFHI